MRVHPIAAAGFGASADAYERGRPGYPSAAIDWLARRLPLGSGVTVVDLAAGTGKLTRRLAATGARVVAVEPLAAMRQAIGSCLGALARSPVNFGVVDNGEGPDDPQLSAAGATQPDAPIWGGGSVLPGHDDSGLVGEDDRLHAVAKLQFHEDPPDVGLDRLFAEVEALG